MADVDHLYALPLEEFIPGRAAAAKEIRKAGDRETAAVVAKLPKPTPAAWTANQVAREQPELIEAMLEAGAELRAAQEAAVSGGGGRGLRDATIAERRAVEAVMTAATAYRPAGRALSRAMADRLRTTLHAAATDEALRDALAAGRLVDEAQAGGAWPFALDPAPREEKRAAKRKAATADDAAKGSAASATGATTKRGAAKGDDAASATGATAKRGAAKGDDAASATGATAKQGAAKGEAATASKRSAAKTADGDDAATKQAAAKARADDAAAAKAAEAERAAEVAARKALEEDLREARSSLRVRERVFTGAEEDASEANDAVHNAKAALEQAQKAAQDAVAEAEAAERVLTEARKALDQARDDVARLEERLD